MQRYSKLGKNVLLITVGSFLSKMMSFLLLPLYTAVLSTADYGIAETMTTTVNLLLPLFTVLIGEAMMRFALERESNKSAIFTTSVVVFGLGIPASCSIQSTYSPYPCVGSLTNT